MRQAGRMWSNGPVHNEAEVKLLNVTMFRFHIMIFGVGLKKEGLQTLISRLEPIYCALFSTSFKWT